MPGPTARTSRPAWLSSCWMVHFPRSCVNCSKKARATPPEYPGGTMTAPDTPAMLWSPSPERLKRSRLRQYMDWLARERGLDFADYDALWRWSVADIEAFWASIWDYRSEEHTSELQSLMRISSAV